MQALVQQVDGLMVRQRGAQARAQLAAVGVAAAWRLGRWSVLQVWESVKCVRGCVRGAQARAQLAAVGVAAAWRLGRWSVVLVWESVRKCGVAAVL